MIGGGCTFLKLAQKVDDVKGSLENDEQKVRHNRSEALIPGSISQQ